MKIRPIIAGFCLFGMGGFMACGGESAAPEATKEAAPAAKNSTVTAEAMLGKWQSTQDPKSAIEIKDGLYISSYEGKVMGKNAYEFHAVCADTICNAGQLGTDVSGTSCFTSRGEFDIDCYVVLKADAQNLEISMIGGDGSALAFKRN